MKMRKLRNVTAKTPRIRAQAPRLRVYACGASGRPVYASTRAAPAAAPSSTRLRARRQRPPRLRVYARGAHRPAPSPPSHRRAHARARRCKSSRQPSHSPSRDLDYSSRPVSACSQRDASSVSPLLQLANASNAAREEGALREGQAATDVHAAVLRFDEEDAVGGTGWLEDVE